MTQPLLRLLRADGTPAGAVRAEETQQRLRHRGPVGSCIGE